MTQTSGQHPIHPQPAPLPDGMAVVHSRVQVGMDAVPIGIEVHVSNGLPAFHLVGLPEKGVRESKERVRSAIINAGFKFPDRRITINLAPAHLPKPDSHLDLPMALGVLLASAQLAANVSAYEFYGELALSGELRPIRSILAAAVGCHAVQRTLVTSAEDATIAAHIDGLVVKVAKGLPDVCGYLQGAQTLTTASLPRSFAAKAPPSGVKRPDLQSIRGQAQAKRALSLASAGCHNIVLRGPPGTGKTMLAQALPAILPDLQPAEQIDIMQIHALCGGVGLPLQRPFRQPHHSASYAAMVGGGQPLMPGEVSLAHHGVLLLDEWSEFKPSVLNALREPLQGGCVHLSRAGYSHTWPARFMLVATCNPCPCGYLGQPRCQCSAGHIQRYQQRISGPLWDRIDMVVDMHVDSHAWSDTQDPGQNSATVQRQVQQCYQRQWQRQQCCNAALAADQLSVAQLPVDARDVLLQATERLGLSMRACDRVLKVARTVSDWSGSEHIQADHVREALGFRCM